MGLRLFEGLGVELEYMIVDSETLSVKPVSDEVLKSLCGNYASEVEVGDFCWSNELVLHVLEVKTNGPSRHLEALPEGFQSQVTRINEILRPLGAQLMPTAMHPWMDPDTESRLWPHEYNLVYESYHRIFDCRGHGWSNLQSVHANLPFSSEEEFGRLHAAIRLLLPLLPALAASSPILDARVTGILDNRLEVYRENQKRVPSITGQVVPEAVFTRRDYEEQILQAIYQEIAPLDPEKILQYEWLNSRGAIARFDRNTIEIRVLDMQECPKADIAVCCLIVAVLRELVREAWTGWEQQKAWETTPLAALFRRTAVQAEETVIEDPAYLECFGLSSDCCTAGELWEHLAEAVPWPASLAPLQEPIQLILQQGPLARRILRAVGPDPSLEHLRSVYRELCGCLAAGQMFSSPGPR